MRVILRNQLLVKGQISLARLFKKKVGVPILGKKWVQLLFAELRVLGNLGGGSGVAPLLWGWPVLSLNVVFGQALCSDDTLADRR